jgi:hypothetical protein
MRKHVNGAPLLRTVCSGVLLLVAALAGLGVVRARPASVLAVVRAHASAYVIYYDDRAATSVVEAAVDLRDHLARATGAVLPIVHAPKAPPAPFIALGDTREARSAGVTIQDMPPDAFVIASRGANLYIAGLDTDHGQTLETGGTSAGTANGVYAFLERFVDVRWLMPGDAGADIPKRADVLVPAGDIKEAPTFPYRLVPYIQNDNIDVARWTRRQRLGYSLALQHGENWEIIGPELFSTHPDWFAASHGRRPKPGFRYKLETTNSGLVEAFAAKAIEAFRRNPKLRSFSLSPADGSYGWSDSAESVALYDNDPSGGVSLTPMILKFYNDVARIVGRQFPDRLLCGYVYAGYLYPPSAGVPAMEPNVCLVVAPSIDYGYQLFRQSVRHDFASLLKTWGRAVHTTGYFDLPSQLVQTMSAPTPASAGILGFVFSTAAASGVKAVYVYGVPDWGYGAATNYVEAKLAWSPYADAHALVAEFYQRAYAPASGVVMGQLNDRLEAALEQYYVSHPKANYNLTPDMQREVYVRLYPDLERSYLSALALCADPAARTRLEMFGRNLILLRWNLRRDNLLADTPSPLARSDVEMRKLLGLWATDLATAPGTRVAASTRLQ